MSRIPTLTTSRAAEIWTEMLSLRRELYADRDFFKVPEAWEAICEGNENWKTATYRTEQEDYKPKAGIAVFGDQVTLTADERLIQKAKSGCKLSNFILAHEIGHLALDHHAKSARTKNFRLSSGPKGMTNSPPTLEELEANLAAVFFQCGVALADGGLDALELAHRACSDVLYVRKAQRFVQLEVFQREVRRPKPKYERVVL